MLKREFVTTVQSKASAAPQETASDKRRRCQALKDDGTVCGTILTRYNADQYVCFSCAQRYAKRGTKPVFAADFRPKSTGKSRGRVPKKSNPTDSAAVSGTSNTSPETADATIASEANEKAGTTT